MREIEEKYGDVLPPILKKDKKKEANAENPADASNKTDAENAGRTDGGRQPSEFERFLKSFRKATDDLFSEFDKRHGTHISGDRSE